MMLVYSSLDPGHSQILSWSRGEKDKMWEWPGDEAKFTLETKIEQPAEAHVRHFCVGWLAKY